VFETQDYDSGNASPGHSSNSGSFSGSNSAGASLQEQMDDVESVIGFVSDAALDTTSLAPSMMSVNSLDKAAAAVTGIFEATAQFPQMDFGNDEPTHHVLPPAIYDPSITQYDQYDKPALVGAGLDSTNPFSQYTQVPAVRPTHASSAGEFGEISIEFGDQSKMKRGAGSKKAKAASSRKRSTKQKGKFAGSGVSREQFAAEGSALINDTSPGSGSDSAKKRKVKAEPSDDSGDVYDEEEPDEGGSAAGTPGASKGNWKKALRQVMPALQWQQHCEGQWQQLLDGYGALAGHFKFEVEVNKGFQYSPIDKAFVCQRKNHFQMTVSLDTLNQPRYAQLGPGRPLQPVKDVFVCVHGIKSEADGVVVPIEQARVDRSRGVLQPVRVQLVEGSQSKLTLARLHFSETTANNMRKKGKPNPEQRFFNLVISLVASIEGTNVTLSAVKSQRIIVRASNLGQFVESEKDKQWVRGTPPQSVVHYGLVGINDQNPTEALSVHGNIQVTGQVLQPSDRRIKQNFQPKDGKQQLENIKRMTLYEYDLKKEWEQVSGQDRGDRPEVGVIAQEMAEILPDAVIATGRDVELADGQMVNNLLVVNKERIFMENVGAVQELCRMTENLENRIQELEQLNAAVHHNAKGSAQQRRGKGGGGAAKQVAAGRGDGNLQRQFPCMRMIVYVGIAMMVFSIFAVGIVIATGGNEQSSSNHDPAGSHRTATPSASPIDATANNDSNDGSAFSSVGNEDHIVVPTMAWSPTSSTSFLG
jgi:hypothetical protein